jgi:hypothetical protein
MHRTTGVRAWYTARRDGGRLLRRRRTRIHEALGVAGYVPSRIAPLIFIHRDLSFSLRFWARPSARSPRLSTGPVHRRAHAAPFCSDRQGAQLSASWPRCRRQRGAAAIRAALSRSQRSCARRASPQGPHGGGAGSSRCVGHRRGGSDERPDSDSDSDTDTDTDRGRTPPGFRPESGVESGRTICGSACGFPFARSRRLRSRSASLSASTRALVRFRDSHWWNL